MPAAWFRRLRTPRPVLLRVFDEAQGRGLFISLPMEMPGANHFLGAHGEIVRRQVKQLARELIVGEFYCYFREGRACDMASMLKWNPDSRRAVTFEQYRRRQLDEGDNDRLVLKPLRDVLVDCGLLRDDSPRWASFEYRQVCGIARREDRRIDIWVREKGTE